MLIGTFAAIYFGFNPEVKSIPLTLQSTPEVKYKKVKINDNVLGVEVANTPASRAKGLGGRDSLGSDSGMLFIFDKAGKYSFWMKGMHLALDFIFIDQGKVVDVLTNIPSPEPNLKDENLPIYQPRVPVKMVLEVNSGYVSSHEIKVGDSVYLVE